MEDMISHVVEYYLKHKSPRVIASFTNTLSFLNIISPSSFYFYSAEKFYHCKKTEIVEIKEGTNLNQNMFNYPELIENQQYVFQDIYDNVSYVALVKNDIVLCRYFFLKDKFCSIGKTLLFTGQDKTDWFLFSNDGKNTKKLKNTNNVRYAEYMHKSNKLLVTITDNASSKIYFYNHGNFENLPIDDNLYCLFPHVSKDDNYIYFTSLDPYLIENGILPKSCLCEIYLFDIKNSTTTLVAKYLGNPLVNIKNNWFGDKFYYVLEELLHKDFASNNLQYSL